jgi:hypothetical protein
MNICVLLPAIALVEGGVATEGSPTTMWSHVCKTVMHTCQRVASSGPTQWKQSKLKLKLMSYISGYGKIVQCHMACMRTARCIDSAEAAYLEAL